MVVKDRPEVKVDISRIDYYGSTCSYEITSPIPRCLIEPIVPKYVAKVVSEKKDIPLKQVVTELLVIVNESEEITRGLIRECLRNGSYKPYLPKDNIDNEILERNDKFGSPHIFLKLPGIEKRDCVVLNGVVCSYSDIESRKNARDAFLADNRSIIYGI